MGELSAKEIVTPAGAPLIELNRLGYAYKSGALSFQVLKNITLTINSGEFVAITGPSGSGKSTLMNILGMLAHPGEGTCSIKGVSVVKLSDDAQASLRNRTIGFIFQQFHLLPRLSVLENVMLPVAYVFPRPSTQERAVYRERAISLLNRLGIGDKADKKPTEISGGQKQRVAIARSLMLNPDIIMADEPSGALDSKTTKEVLQILSELNSEGKTVIIITHDPAVTQVARRRIELVDGQVVSDVEQAVEPFVATLHPEAAPVKSALVTTWSEFKARMGQSMAPLRDAYQALFSSKLRTILTSIGLIIGVTSIIIMITLGSSAQGVILKIFDQAGADRVYIGYDWRKAGYRYWRGLHTETEVPAIQRVFNEYARIVPLSGGGRRSIRGGGQKIESRVIWLSGSQDMVDEGFKLDRGRQFSPYEYVNPSQAVIVGSDFAKELFPEKYAGRATNPNFPIGESIYVDSTAVGYSLKVVGVMKKKDTTFDSREANQNIFVTRSTGAKFDPSPFTSWIAAVPKPGVSHRWLADSLSNYLRFRTGFKFPFRAEVPEETIGKIMMFITVFQALTALIGGLCILVGGIGIMNIMLVTITERIKEIGLKKAIGARISDIKQQFLSECIVLCLASGVIGILLGIGFCNMVGVVAHLALPDLVPNQFLFNMVAVAMALGTSVFCGIGFGMLPALRASRMDAAEALRSE